MTLYPIIRRIHLWAGILLGAQVLLWILSGVVMSWYDIQTVRGEHLRLPEASPELETTSYASPGGVIAQMDGATSVELRSFLNRTVYEVQTVGGAALFDAKTGDRISPLDEKTARIVARNDFVGDGQIRQLRLTNNPPQEFRRSVPVWRVDFTDRLHTRLYISPDTGEVLARRNDLWRLYDFFWMLHIMDYEDRTNFNNPLLKFASAASLVFALSGLVMVFLKNGRMLIARDVRYVVSKFRPRKNKPGT